MVVQVGSQTMMTMEEVCATYKVSEQTVRRWIRERSFPGVKFGRFWRFEAAAVQAWDAAELAKMATSRAAV